LSFFTENLHPQAFKQLSGRNFFRQQQYLKDTTELLIRDLPAVKLYASFIRDLNYLAVCGVNDSPGQYRKQNVRIISSSHQPPNYNQVCELISDLCVFVSDQWDNYDAFDLAAYTLWRLTWIHPFEDGNGRTANAVAYYVLCRKLEF